MFEVRISFGVRQPSQGPGGKAKSATAHHTDWRNIHTGDVQYKAITPKSAQSASGVVGLGRPLARFKGPSNACKPSRSPRFSVVDPPRVRYHTHNTHEHTRRVWCGVEPSGSENGKSDVWSGASTKNA